MPLPLLQTVLLAAAVPLVGTFIAVLTTAAVMQILNGGGFEVMMQRLAQPEGSDSNNDLAVETAGVLFDVTLLAITLVLSTRYGARTALATLSWRGWTKDRSFLPFLACLLTWQALDELLIEPAVPALVDLQRMPSGTTALLVSLLSSAVAGPVAQELFFRGFVHTHLRAHVGPVATITMTAFFFAFMHLGDSLAVPVSMLPYALIAGAARERYGSVQPAIYLHVIWSLIAWGDSYFGIAPLLPSA